MGVVPTRNYQSKAKRATCKIETILSGADRLPHPESEKEVLNWFESIQEVNQKVSDKLRAALYLEFVLPYLSGTTSGYNITGGYIITCVEKG